MVQVAETPQLTSLVAYSLLASSGLWLGLYTFHRGRHVADASPQRLFRSLAASGVLIFVYGVYGIVGLVMRTSMFIAGFLDLVLLLFMLLLVMSIRHLHQDTALALNTGRGEAGLHRWIERGIAGIIIIEGGSAFLLGESWMVQFLVASIGGLIVVYGLLYDTRTGATSSIHGTTLDAFRRLLVPVLGFAGVIAVSHAVLLVDGVPFMIRSVEITIHVLIAAFLFVLTLRVRQVM